VLALAAGVPCVSQVAFAQGSEPAPASPPAPVPDAAPGAAEATPVVCTVSDAGAEPRAERRYTPAVGDVASFEFVVINSQRMETPDNAVPEIAMPPITFVTKTTVQSVAAGVITADLVFESVVVGADPVLGPRLEQMLRPLVGTGGTMKISDRGEDMGFTLSADAQALGPGASMVAAVANSLRGVVATVPAEPIGTGATWTSVESQPDDQGILVTQTITHTLKSAEGGGYEIDLVLAQSAASQVLPSPPSMPGAVLRLESLAGKGTATVSGSFGSVLPAKVELELTATTVRSFRQGDASQSASLTTKTSAEGRTLPPAE
jgi:hypothetical protein